MKLVIGGCAQGKLAYVMERYKVESSMVWDGQAPVNLEPGSGTVVVNHLHRWIKASMARGGCPEREIFDFAEEYPDCVLISDQVGNGIVPADAFEREYRERTGRILTELAAKAEEVDRVMCGIGQTIKSGCGDRGR